MGYMPNTMSVVPMSINLPNTDYAKGGVVLKELREKAGLSVPELANIVSEGAYHDILKYEQGYAKVPYTQINIWAEGLKVSPGYLARRLVEHYDPTLYEILYGDDTLKLSASDQ